MTYNQAIAFLNSFINFERVPEARMNTTQEDVERFREMLGKLGNPQSDYRVVHIAGTKGKGSTAAMLAAILGAAGYRVGLYTSPHLVSVRERILVNGRMMSRARFGKLIAVTSAAAGPGDPDRLAFRTVFEQLTAAAFLHFSREKVQIAVVEAGLGGKLDATTVVDPCLSILTVIGLDHVAVLGNTIAAIAADKAHIIKRGVPVISAPQKPEAMQQIEIRRRAVAAPLTMAQGVGEFTDARHNLTGSRFRSARREFAGMNIILKLAGRFQLENVSVVLEAVDELRRQGFEIPTEAVLTGLRRVRWPGRLQVVKGDPPLILDGSHNALSMEALVEALKLLAPESRYTVVFSALHGKNVGEMLEFLKNIASKVYLAPLRFPKGMSRDELAELAEKTALNYELHDNVPQALEAARAGSGHGESLLITGSFYLVGEVLRHVRGLPPPPSDGTLPTDA